MTRDAKALLILASVVLATGLPFVHRAFFVDDYYFVTMAKGILQNPWRPYDFKSDDAGIGNVAWERRQKPRMVNPPLFHYLLAGIIKGVGEETWKLRTASLLFSFAALGSMYFLGKRFVPNPLSAALLMAVCPVYWLTSYSLLIDSALIAFLLASLLVFMIGHERCHLGWLALSGVLLGLTMLVKYFGALAVVLAFIWQVLDEKRRSWKASYLVYGIFVLILLLWGLWNIATYGQMHLLAALQRGMQATSWIAWVQKSIVLGSFIGGGVFFVLVTPALLWRVSKGWCAGLAVMVCILYALFVSKGGGFDPLQAVLIAVFIGGTFSFLVVMARALDPARDRRHLFLYFWIGGGLLELVFVMPWTAGRYLLSVLPAIVWIFALEIDRWHASLVHRSAFVATALAGLLLAQADYSQANTIVHLADRLRSNGAHFQQIAPRPAHHWYYLADTFDGSQPYLTPLGWENVMPYQKFKRGDLFLRAYYRKSSWWNTEAQTKNLKPLLTIEVRSRNPFRVMDVPASAGFYASCWGALPWMITGHPLERFELYQAVSE